jgi:capsule polysaccharide export protein KpsC/LpsZ
MTKTTKTRALAELTAEMIALEKLLRALEETMDAKPRPGKMADRYCHVASDGFEALMLGRETVRYDDPAAQALKRLKQARRRAEGLLERLEGRSETPMYKPRAHG